MAPFFTDIDISSGVGQVGYEIHTGATSAGVLSQVNELINNCTKKAFNGNWLLVASWEDVPRYGGSINMVSSVHYFIICINKKNPHRLIHSKEC